MAPITNDRLEIAEKIINLKIRQDKNPGKLKKKKVMNYESTCVNPKTSTSSPTLIVPCSTRPVATVPRPFNMQAKATNAE